MTFIKQHLKKIILTACLGLFVGTGFVFAQTFVNNEASDNSDIVFSYDTQTEFRSNEPMNFTVSLVDTITGNKPSGSRVVMSINEGAYRSIMPANSSRREITVDLRNYGAVEGANTVSFQIPSLCGNFFDYSGFDRSTRFNNSYDCQYETVVRSGDFPEPEDDVLGCTDPFALNHNLLATIDDESCRYSEPVSGCTDDDATNHNPSATQDDGTCIFGPNIGVSDFECSVNNRIWERCEGKTYVLTKQSDPLYVRTESNPAAWNSFCEAYPGNGAVIESIDPISGLRNIRLNFDFQREAPANLYDMTLCLDATGVVDSVQSFKLKLTDFQFVEN